VKAAVTGDGAADKRAVQTMVTKLLRLPDSPEPPDAADALALALCHAWRERVAAATRGADANRGESRLQARIDAAVARQGAGR